MHGVGDAEGEVLVPVEADLGVVADVAEEAPPEKALVAVMAGELPAP